MIVSTLFLFLFSGAAATGVTPEEAFEAEERALDSRSQVTHGSLKIHYEWVDDPSLTSDVSVWFDYRGTRRQRWDYATEPHRTMQKDLGEIFLADPDMPHRETMVIDGETQYWWSPDVFDKMPRIAVTIQNDEESPKKHLSFDPLVIGLTHGSFTQYWAANPKEFLTHAERRDAKGFTEVVDGRELICSEFTSGKNVAVQLWISPSQGNSLVRLKTNYPYQGEPFTTDTVIEVKPNADGTVWFPESVKIDRRHGERPMACERMLLTDVVLNEELEEDVFTLAGMQIPAGTPVLGEPGMSGMPRIWNGSTVIDDPAPPKVKPDRVPVPRKGPLLLMGVNFGALAVVMLAFRSWRRSA